MKTLIAPSILSANLARLQEEVDSIEGYADWLQVDVMDGHFVPNLSFGAPVVKCINTKLIIDVHLMVTNPAYRVTEFLHAGAKHITFHAETIGNTADRMHIIEAIRKGGATAGIALKPATPIAEIQDIVDSVDLVLIMSVEPGFGGQVFMPEVVEKIRELRAAHPNLMIQVDGGINRETAQLCREAGANNLVAGNFIFGSKIRADAIQKLRG
jgi:ribulose-phosphate 3-epimerase